MSLLPQYAVSRLPHKSLLAISTWLRVVGRYSTRGVSARWCSHPSCSLPIFSYHLPPASTTLDAPLTRCNGHIYFPFCHPSFPINIPFLSIFVILFFIPSTFYSPFLFVYIHIPTVRILYLPIMMSLIV